jgi:TaqI-like C-terminal specificity domain/Eco57I restriction-modification methylase
MESYETEERKAIDGRLKELLEAPKEMAALQALRKLFVTELDFDQRVPPVSIALDGDGLPQSATLIASREGVQVVVVRLPSHGRVLVRSIRETLGQIKEQLGGDVLLAAGSVDGSEWQLVYPSTRGEKEILRRITLHRGQPYRTVAEQLANVYYDAGQSDLRNALESAYDVEAVTKEFFKEYKRIFDRAMERIEGLPDDEERRLFCQTLFNRLMFIYFLQRKGWLTFGGSPNYLHSLWNDARRKSEENFYNVRLKLLFFMGLNNPQSADFDRARSLVEDQIGRVPFLNGGLFDETELDKRPAVYVPNEAIEPILNDLFRRFNFTISESTPYDIQVAVDPEMLGKVFEELVTGRHGTGSYYTPRPIVSFMCREALKGYLKTRLPDLGNEATEKYVDQHEVGGIDRGQAGHILEVLETITVVDPACGSGAYLLGMMQELLELEGLLFNPQLLASPKSVYDMKLRIIERNVYGVDIDPFAVNTAMLRLWLSLIVEYEGSGDPPPLPNLDFKIACGDSLTGPSPQELIGDMFRARAHEMAIELARLKAEYMQAVGPEKDGLHHQIEATMHDLSGMMAHSDVPEDAVDWRVVFAEVFERGGFDVVVANPPYVRMELIKSLKPRLRALYPDVVAGRADLYVYFYARAIELLGDGGMIAFISSDKWLRAGYGARLRAYVSKQVAVNTIIDFGELPVFKAAATFPMIFVGEKGAVAEHSRFTQVKSLGLPYPDILAITEQFGFGLEPAAVKGETWELVDRASAHVSRTMERASVPLLEYIDGEIYYGVKTGLNEAFYLTEQQRDAIVRAQPACAAVIKPLIVGNDIRRWRVDAQPRWLIYTPPGIGMSEYGAILDHLRFWKTSLEARALGQRWYELQQAQFRYAQTFARPKIVFPDIAKEARFALDVHGGYISDTCFALPVADKFLLAVLNSRSAWMFLRERSAVLGDADRGGRLRLKRQYMEMLPIPAAPAGERRALVSLVESCLSARGGSDEAVQSEAEINSRVARLYGLAGDQSAATATGAPR